MRISDWSSDVCSSDLIGKPLPRVEDSVRIGELLRRAVMSEAKRQLGENAIPSVLSGHGLDMDGKHRHAFFLPWDGSGDGRIDRLVLHVPDGIGLQERRIVEKLRRLWRRAGTDWQLAVARIGEPGAGGSPLTHAKIGRAACGKNGVQCGEMKQ